MNYYIRAALNDLESLLYNDFMREHVRAINRGKLYGLSEEVQNAVEETIMNLCEQMLWRFTQVINELDNKEDANERAAD